MRSFVHLSVLALASARRSSELFVVPPPKDLIAAAPYAPWAHSHMVWLSSDRSNQANVSAYVASYAANNITVGGIDIDSMWSLGVNDFRVDPVKFPDMGGLVAQMHATGINVILWATSMIDTDSSNYGVAVNSSFAIQNAVKETANFTWWHGTGVLLDYFGDSARSWWETQLDNVLSLGIE